MLVAGKIWQHMSYQSASDVRYYIEALILLLLLLHQFNGLFTRTTWVSRHQKGKPFCFLLEQEMMGWQWHQLDHIICKSFAPWSRQITMPVPHHSVFTSRIPFLPPNQQHQSTEGDIKALIMDTSINLYVMYASMPYMEMLASIIVWPKTANGEAATISSWNLQTPFRVMMPTPYGFLC